MESAVCDGNTNPKTRQGFGSPCRLSPTIQRQINGAHTYGACPLTLLDLNGTAVHEKLHASHKAGVVRSQEDSRFCNLVRLSKTAQGHGRGEVIVETLPLFFCLSKTAESRSVDWAGAHDIHTDLTILQVRRPSAGEGTHCRFGR